MRIYTDGACIPNPGKGSWAWVNEDGVYNRGLEEDTTNNRMEMIAVIMAIDDNRNENNLEIFCDNSYVVDGANTWRHKWKKNGWRIKPKQELKNADLWEILSILCDSYQPNIYWIKGHNGHELNERADFLCEELLELSYDIRIG